ncbi:hypothetical protein [Clostridium gasigenes]|uniref:Uncharacterized protein n=1 Tax=Clostridium gasigenes TaxID=94869 RepID=A0A1H0T2K7_9CLOT|nr:hypothetical protein [Clostridium gasigenes]MBB6623803.1 hypothetical protein [Clostridium gasigenes]MBU3090118.1 hypothetical protein [Clostridium gasigenes]SDP48011.1 hypothetical protein SAMN04488529_10621 [Clostridium gasigenes]
MAKNNTKNKSKNNKKNKTKNNKKVIDNKVIDKKKITGWKGKVSLFILILEVLVEVGMLGIIFARGSFNISQGSKIIWIIYLIIQIILGFTILSKKKDDSKGTFHLQTVLVTITYLLVA